MLEPLDCGFHSDKGPFRDRNEDVAHASTNDGIFIVADGLGGAAAGDRAARMATDLMCFGLLNELDPVAAVEKVLPESQVREAIQDRVAMEIDMEQPCERTRFAFLIAHFGVLMEGSRSGSVGMATAMVSARSHGDFMCIGHVGDCRAYTWVNNKLTLLTRDHSLSMALAGRDGLPRGAENSAYLRSRLTQVVGGEVTPTPDICNWTPERESILFLCSDGVWGSLKDRELERIIGLDTTAEHISQSMVEAAIAAGSRDNATALVVRF